MDVFDLIAEEDALKTMPLAMRLKPKSLEDFVGQEHIIGKGSFLREMIDKDNLRSIILHGPSGTGKTSIASIIAKESKAHFIEINAVSSGVEEIRKAVEKAKESRLYNKRCVLFIDEVHRFNKRQQDALLPYVENGLITLIGATTENPYFEVNSALLSRVMILNLKPLQFEDISAIVKSALKKDGQLRSLFSGYEEEALQILYKYCAGDARKALNALDICSLYAEGDDILSADLVKKAFDANSMQYDKSGDMHYDVISAFIKSIRGSDPQAAIHYLARMLEAGEDPMFIARRLVILASEDVGNADPMGLVLAIAAKDALHFVGMPEGRIPLAQATTYLASTLKSNRAYQAINRAQSDVRKREFGIVPFHIRDSAEGYLYPHDYKGGYVKQSYMPEKLEGTVYYEPTERGRERSIKEYLDLLSGGKKHDE